MSSGISTKFTDLAEETVSIIEHVVHAANLIKECTDLITGQDSASGASFCMRHVSLLYRVEMKRKSLLRWFEMWIASVPTKPTGDTRRFAQTLGQGDMELYLSYQCFLILYNRIYTALNGDKGRDLEREAQQLAKALGDSPHMKQYRVAGAGAVMCNVTSKATLATADEWREFAKDVEHEGALRIMEPEVYCRWIALCGIPAPERYRSTLSVR